MRIAAISDIHGNVAALDAVLADIAARGVDMTVNLGDIVSGGLFPRATTDRLMPLGLPTIRGNHERQLLMLAAGQMGESDRYAAAELRRDQLDWIESLPATLRPAEDVLMVHGTPVSDLTYWLETVTPEGLRAATAEEIAERAGDAEAAVILCGHTHIARAVRLGDGRLVVNPGSVGLPAYADALPFPHVAESGSPHARYAIVTRGEEGWSAELIDVAYDWDGAARAAEAHGRPDWAHALRTGRIG